MSQVLIITGMHRSGTSLVANLIQEAGVNIGSELLGPAKGNRRGHFEDREFVEFHEGVLRRLGLTFLTQTAPEVSEFAPAEVEAAQALIRQRNAYALWGWKDPRTSIFLDCWRPLLGTGARYLLVYRHPLEVVLSLLRRGSDLEVAATPWVGLKSWQVYNEAIRSFHQRNPEVCLLCNISGVTEDVKGFIALAWQKLELQVGMSDCQDVYRPGELTHLASLADGTSLLQQMAPDAIDLYDQLEAEADLPGCRRERTAPGATSSLQQLQKVVKALAGMGSLRELLTSSLFLRLLAVIDPQSVAESREALDKYRLGHIQTLQQVISGRERQLQDIETRVTDLNEGLLSREAHIQTLKVLLGELEQRVREKDVDIQTLSFRLGEHERQIREKDSRLQALSFRLEEQVQQIEEKDSRLQALTVRLEEQLQQIQEKDSHIHTLAVRLEEHEQLAREKDADIQTRGIRLEEHEQLAREKDANIQTLAIRLEEHEKRVREKDQKIQELTTHRSHLEQELATIASSRVWRLGLKWYAFRYFLRDALRNPRALFARRSVQRANQPGLSSLSQAAAGPGTAVAPRPQPKILFVSHDAHRHGAPILLLHLLKWLKAKADIPFEILLKGDGELRLEFEALAPVWSWDPGGAATASLVRHCEEANIRLVYSNTITNGSILAALSGLDCPVISHIHELDYWITYRTEPDNNRLVKDHTSRYIAVSRAVKRALTESLKVPEEKIDVVHEFIEVAFDSQRLAVEASRIRAQHDIPPEALVVGASGTTDWRKGPDLFVLLARALRRRQTELQVHFVWVGGDNTGPVFGALWHDAERCGLGDCMHFVGARPNPQAYFALFDVFTLVSREDPFPLVCLEAGALGKPVVCFEGSGGAQEFVETDCGFVVPYLDVEAMADKVAELLAAPELRQRLGRRAAQKVREKHDVNVVAPQILNIIRRFY